MRACRLECCTVCRCLRCCGIALGSLLVSRLHQAHAAFRRALSCSSAKGRSDACRQILAQTLACGTSMLARTTPRALRSPQTRWHSAWCCCFSTRRAFFASGRIFRASPVHGSMVIPESDVPAATVLAPKCQHLDARRVLIPPSASPALTVDADEHLLASHASWQAHATHCDAA